jgi:Protein of unknown function DUF262/Protein of unknown function (DUF1524)
VKTDTRTVTQLFDQAVRYVVPLYQRPYVWREKDQWQPLLDDILTLIEHRENGGTEFYSHFLGAIVLEQEIQPPGEIPMFTVIDGQQRLTTLQIVLAAASNLASSLGAANEGAIVRDLLRNDPKKAAGTALYKVWPTNANRSAFKAVLSDGGPPDDRADDPHNRIDEAYSFFVANLEEWATEVDGDARLARMRTLRITLCDLLKVVSITLEADDNAQVIFETLNARGTPLLALDLVKNSVFLEASRQGLATETLYEERWKPEFDVAEMDKYWRAERRQGRLKRPVAELFLMHWLTMRSEKLVPATELFTTFRSRILNEHSNDSIEVIIDRLCRDAETMRSFDKLPVGSVEAKFFERLEILDTTTLIPLILLLFTEPGVDPVRRTRCLLILESWLVRRLLMGLSAKNYSQQTPLLVGKVRKNLARADEVILDDLRSGEGEASRWPGDAELRARLVDQNIYNWVRQDRIAMVLAAVEATLYSSKVEALTIPTKLSIEHIIPQKWEANWPLPVEGDAETVEAAEERRRNSIHRLGNLTIVTHALNASLSNAVWAKKQKHLNEHSKLLLNARLVSEYGDRFDDDSVAERGAWLADRIIEIWPGPDAWQ